MMHLGIPFSTSGLSNSGSNENRQAGCQFVGAFAVLRNFACTSSKWLAMRGQKSGKDTAVNRNVYRERLPFELGGVDLLAQLIGEAIIG